MNSTIRKGKKRNDQFAVSIDTFILSSVSLLSSFCWFSFHDRELISRANIQVSGDCGAFCRNLLSFTYVIEKYVVLYKLMMMAVTIFFMYSIQLKLICRLKKRAANKISKHNR